MHSVLAGLLLASRQNAAGDMHFCVFFDDALAYLRRNEARSARVLNFDPKAGTICGGIDGVVVTLTPELLKAACDATDFIYVQAVLKRHGQTINYLPGIRWMEAACFYGGEGASSTCGKLGHSIHVSHHAMQAKTFEAHVQAVLAFSAAAQLSSKGGGAPWIRVTVVRYTSN